MAIGTAARLATQVAVVVLVLSATVVPAAAVTGALAATSGSNSATAHDEKATTSGDLFAGTMLNERASGEPLQSSDITASTSVDSPHEIIIGEQLERGIQQSVGTLGEAAELLPSLAALGYSRYDDSDPLTNDRRSAVYETITASPGIYLSKLSEKTGIHRSTVRYHVRILEDEKLIAKNVFQGKHRLYPVEQDYQSLIAALDNEATAGVLQALLRLEPASVSVLATDLDRAPSTVSHHLVRLAENELVTRERDGNVVFTCLSPHVRETMQSEEEHRAPNVSARSRAD